MSDSTVTGSSAISSNGGLNNEPVGSLRLFDIRFINDQPPDVFP